MGIVSARSLTTIIGWAGLLIFTTRAAASGTREVSTATLTELAALALRSDGAWAGQ